MGELTRLITQWEQFQGQNPGGTATEFCNFFLLKEKKEQNTGLLFNGMISPDGNVNLSKLISRIAHMQMVYLKAALKDTSIDLNWFYTLNAINYQKEARKVDIINFLLIDQSTGIDLMKRLKKAGLITERLSPEDKRAKLVKLTQKGEQMLQELVSPIYKTTFLMFNDITEDEKNLLITLLGPIEIKHQAMISHSKNKNIDDLLALTYSETELKPMHKMLAKYKKG